MTAAASVDGDRDWERFVIDHGRGAAAQELATVLARPVADIDRIRATGACSKLVHRKTYAELFCLWHGRAPSDDEWPPPRKKGGRSGYEWQAPELALLASLVGGLGKKEIAQVLTKRLRSVTGDQAAVRSAYAVQVAINRIGMQSKDVLDGITTAEAAREIGSLAMINQAIHKGDIRARRVGRLWVIPHAAWAAWKSGRTFPPAGYIPLATLKQSLAIRSDKLSEFARLGYVTTAIRCNPFGTGLHSTRFGTWYIDEKVATRLVTDRRAGHPMPWHGKPLIENLRATYKLWQTRKHPAACKTCADIWGRKGVPRTFEDYVDRYPPLARGAKRHLTMAWFAGLTVREVADQAERSVRHVRLAITNGALAVESHAAGTRVTRTDATRWISRGCPTGDQQSSWISLSAARKRYLFTKTELEDLVARGKLKSKTGTEGAMRRVVYVSRQQCANLREKTGFTETEAARRAGLPLKQFRSVLAGVNWRKTEAIPLVTVQAVIKRLNSRPGYTIREAARSLRKTVAWVEARITDGTVKVLRRTWDTDRVYLSEPMMTRLRQATANPARAKAPPGDCLRLTAAALEAGVTGSTINKWAESGELERIKTPTGWKYPRKQVRARARRYWRNVRFHRATPPQWLSAGAND